MAGVAVRAGRHAGVARAVLHAVHAGAVFRELIRGERRVEAAHVIRIAVAGGAESDYAQRRYRRLRIVVSYNFV